MAERRRIQPGERIAKKPDRPAGYKNLVLEQSFSLEENRQLERAYMLSHDGYNPSRRELLAWIRQEFAVKENILARAQALIDQGGDICEECHLVWYPESLALSVQQDGLCPSCHEARWAWAQR